MLDPDVTKLGPEAQKLVSELSARGYCERYKE